MKIGDLLVTEDKMRVGIILEGAHDWFHRRGEDYDEEPNLFYIYWVDVLNGEEDKTMIIGQLGMIVNVSIFTGKTNLLESTLQSIVFMLAVYCI